VALYELTKTAITALDQTTFATQDINERYDLQRLLRQHFDVIAPDTLIIAEEFCKFDESKRRVDLLGVDREASLVVVELKRTEDGGHMELQAIRYAAMVSAMTFSQAVEVYARYLKRNNSTDDAETALLQFLEWDVANKGTFGRDVRIVLVSAEFSKEITTSVLWLNEHELDIRCVRLRPYALETRVLLDVQQVIPLPEAAEYTEQINIKKAEEIRNATPVEFDFSKYDLTIDGNTHSHLPKRRLVFEVVKAALAKGLTPEQIAGVVPPRKWISVEGDLTADEFRDRASKLQAELGRKFDSIRYFCDDGELFQITGRTYALSNQWTLTTAIAVVDQVIAKLPPGSMSYAKTSESD
jgi:RecB family endonuclease NucS